MPSYTSTVVIAGAGVFGAAAALELARRGYGVILTDPGPIPHPLAASNDISKAVRADYGSDELYATLMESALAGWEHWNRTGPEQLFHPTGMLFLKSHAMEQGTFERASFDLLSSRSYPLSRLDSTTISERYPAWNTGRYIDGYLNPRAGWAASWKTIVRLMRDCVTAGVRLVQGFKAVGLVEDGSRILGLRSEMGEEIVADWTVLATGAWTLMLLPELEDFMEPIGQPVLHFAPKDLALYQPEVFPVWGADIAETGWYGFPATSQGAVKVANHGPGRAIHPDEPRSVLPEEVERFREFLAGSIPGLATANIHEARLCLYTDTFDGHFWIDRHPDRPGLVVATGGSGHAFKFAPVLGGLVADALEGHPNVTTDRFRWRERTRAQPGGGRAN